MHVKITHTLVSFFLFLTFQQLGLAQNCLYTVNETHQGPSCPGGNNGTIVISVNGATGPYYYVWEAFVGSGIEPFNEDQTGLTAGIYRVTVFDSSACQVQLDVTLIDNNDTQAPQLFCPQSQVFNLGSGECSKVVNFQVYAADNCAPNPVITQTDTTGYSSGDAFPIGTTHLSFAVTDGNNLTTCTFFIKVNEYDPPGNPSLSCAGPLNVSVNENCSADLSANVLLNGNQHGCYDDYQITFLSPAGMPITPAQFSNYLNKTIFARVHDPESNSFCFSSITLKDFLKPKINCIDSIEVSCSASSFNVSPPVLGYPEVIENCGDFDLTFFDQWNEITCQDTAFGGAYSGWIKRTWNAEDSNGNDALPCRQYIFFKRKNINNVDFPKNLSDLPGDLPSLDCSAPDDSPAATGVPMVEGLPIYPNGASQCEFQVSYSDNLAPACGGGYNILRTWTVNDACNNELKSHLQFIRIKDQEAPVITCPSSHTISTNTGECKATFFLPTPHVTDNCSGYNVQVQHSSGNLVGNLLLNVPLGLHQIIYRATDDCGNFSTCQMSLTVFDGYEPTAICDPSKSVSLTTTGQTSLNASIFNNGSFDDCGGTLHFTARRLSDACNLNNPNWANQIKFCCEDIGTTVPLEVKVTDLSGNFSICNSNVNVADFLPPSITCPSSFTVGCNISYSDVTIFGKIATSIGQQNAIQINNLTYGMDGISSDNCSVEIEELPVDININDCHQGVITRYFKATDPAGLSTSCTQQIIFENNDPFYINVGNFFDPNDDVEWPGHTSVSDCNGNVEPAITGLPVIFNNNCSQVEFTHSDQVFPQSGSSHLIKRKWTVIDFCQFNGIQGIWNYNQNITVYNTDVIGPELSGFFEIVRFCSQEIDCSGGQVEFGIQAIDDCTQANALIWDYDVDLENDGTIDLTGSTSHISAMMPLGIHKTIWKVTDGAGNVSSGIQFLLVEDCTPPSLTCHDTLYVTLDGFGNLQLLAQNMQAGFSTDNCSEYVDLRFEAALFDAGHPTDYPPNVAASAMNFTCPANIYQVQLWAGDEMDNWSSCAFILHVSDYFDQCEDVVPAFISIEGNIYTETGKNIEQVTVSINGGNPGNSDTNGFYEVTNLPGGADFTVIPQKDINPLNGVTTFDLVLIRRHILGVQALDSPYKIIAADINRSNTVTTFDLVALQKLILFVDQDFTNNNSWRFLEAGFVFPNPLNPFETVFPEVSSFNNLIANKVADFIGIKIGDVNDSANPSNINNEVTELY